MDHELLQKKAEGIRAVAFDMLGVMFSSAVWVHPHDGEMLRMRSHIDGQGISYLRAAGIDIAFLTSEENGFAEHLVHKLNALPSVTQGVWKPIRLFAGAEGKDKKTTLSLWCQSLNVPLDACAYMGDELSDLPALEMVGLSAAPVSAEVRVRDAVDFVASRRGGEGAVRDLADYILHIQGIDQLSLARK